MTLNGCLEKLTYKTAVGWISMSTEMVDNGFKPLVRIVIRKKLCFEGVPSQSRDDISSKTLTGLGFSLVAVGDIEGDLTGIVAADITATLTAGDETVVLKIWQALETALQVRNMSRHARENFFLSLDQTTSQHAAEFYSRRLLSPQTSTHQRSRLAVLTYANDAGAWFPYFFSYYRDLAGANAIYVITPNPKKFLSYDLGGVISSPEMKYDDGARAFMVSNLATGLQAYYEWVVVCDVDEFIVPHPASGQDFFQVLDSTNENVVLTRGLDVVQSHDEQDFDFSRTIISQRRFAVPNTAMCKPSVCRVPIVYCGGHHYCQVRLDFAPPGHGFLNLHLKWACRNVRRQVLEIVGNTTYSSAETETYSRRSIRPDAAYPGHQSLEPKRTRPLSSVEMSRFEAQYRKALTYSADRDLWRGEHKAADFAVDLQSAITDGEAICP